MTTTSAEVPPLEKICEGLLIGAADGVGWICFDNPQRRNAMSLKMALGLREACGRLLDDDDVRAVVVRGSGEKAFMSGADLSVVSSKDAAKTIEEGFSILPGFGKPLIALIHGWCLGGGLRVALSADIRIASDQARFGIPATKLGAGHTYSSVHALVAAVGPANASEILLVGEPVDAHRAYSMGLVNRVVAPADVDSVAYGVARTIAANAPLAVRAAQHAITNATLDPSEQDTAAVLVEIAACDDSEDFAEGARAFLEKRPPRFVGR